MADEFITFQRFGDKQSAQELMKLLDQHHVESQFEDDSTELDAQLGGGGFANYYTVKLRHQDFEKANQILIEDAVEDLNSIDKDYYLFGFTDAELHDIVAHPDEWNPFDFLLAQKLLKERGQEIKPEEIKILQQQRIAELSKPEPSQTLGIIAGYFFALLGGLVGIIIGWFLSSHKKTLPNGDRVYNYSESDRRHGKRILYLGLFFFILWIAVKIFLLPRLGHNQ